MWSAFANQTIYLDSNIIIYAIERGYRQAHTMRAMLEAIDRRAFRAVTSELTIAEVMSKPLALNDLDHISKYERFFAPNSALAIPAISRETLLLAARMQGSLGLKLFDSIHVATAQLEGCDCFLTEDERLGRAIAGETKWLKLSEVG
ncbi:type II toxin-antitoxin system VapC family toxin [Tardiphaga sp.]|uniref:type II toxin-antitoxin system VapC family toxin n=1 Tax=Tardiphaga sp. TaxID=1926292 RepID=UPI002615A278|nr:type II toxin-antitoxin system VapC family toxin [Tardiphaga sp.]MDB5615817.1 PilT protein-like [Tardiphaga sp.]